jgi:hypothetical protein
MTDLARFQATAAAITAAGHKLGQRYHHDARLITACVADEDGCSYEHCPRWRDGVLIDERHCALDYAGDEP